MWSECSWVIRMAESECGSSPSIFIRLKVSRHEMPASSRIFVRALAMIALFPRLPLASSETETPMPRSIPSLAVEAEVSFGLAGTLVPRQRLTGPRVFVEPIRRFPRSVHCPESHGCSHTGEALWVLARSRQVTEGILRRPHGEATVAAA